MEENENIASKRNRSKPKLESGAQVYDYALKLLSYRDHSQKEISGKLKRRGAEAEHVESSIAKLTEYGIMDEERFARRVYEAWLAKRSYGRLHLNGELQKKGVPSTLIVKILEQFSADQEQERAALAAEQFCKLNRRKLEQALHAGEPKAKQRVYAAAGRYMAARGFDSGHMRIMLDCLDEFYKNSGNEND